MPHPHAPRANHFHTLNFYKSHIHHFNAEARASPF
jgi:hypothetical protein